ncbi:Hypothetical predicted protein [Lecanosticta acicola]|uniref:Uncharacterized protein n=1 Tax=Lecanosticta acicola TaxID=111012 RepID=A0AAI8Z303_9PEZI|nr:Hypothetical predicted protein [Lecanosticta acicola]
MLLSTGIIALSRKIKDERHRKKEAKQGLLNAQDSEAARRAFANQRAFQTGDGIASGMTRSGTRVKYEQAEDVASPQQSTNGHPSLQDTELAATRSPSEPSNGQDAFASLSSFASSSALSPGDVQPIPCSPATPLSSVFSIDSPIAGTLSNKDQDDQSTSSGHASFKTDSEEIKCIRIRTRGNGLKSGFPYHAGLFDLHVRPDQWEQFTAQVVESTKFTAGDHAQMWGAATATALSGALMTSIYVGRSMNRSLQEKKVRSGLQDTSDGGLGETLRRWNQNEFRDLGIFVHLELSESAMKRQHQKHHSFRKPTSLYSKHEDRDRKTEERKFCIVVSKLDGEGFPSEAFHELAGEEARVLEMADPKNVIYEVPELPGDEGTRPAELPVNGSLGYTRETTGTPHQYCAELESAPVELMEKSNLDDESPGNETTENEDFEENAALRPAPLMVTAETHAALDKEVT